MQVEGIIRRPLYEPPVISLARKRRQEICDGTVIMGLKVVFKLAKPSMGHNKLLHFDVLS